MRWLNESAILSSAVTIVSGHISFSFSFFLGFSHIQLFPTVCDLCIQPPKCSIMMALFHLSNTNARTYTQPNVCVYMWTLLHHVLVWSNIITGAGFAPYTRNPVQCNVHSINNEIHWLHLERILLVSAFFHGKSVEVLPLQMEYCAHFYRLDTGFQLLWNT